MANVVTNPTSDQSIQSFNLLPAAGNASQSLGSSSAPWLATLVSETTGKINNIVILDGVVYPFTGAGLQSAINAATTNGTVPGKVIIPPTASGSVITLTASIGIPSNFSLEGPGIGLGVTGSTIASTVVLQAQSGFSSTLMTLTNVSNVILRGFAIDGNGTGNSIIDISGSRSVLVEDIRMGNCGVATALGIIGSNSYIAVHACEMYRCGAALPSVTGSGIALQNGNNSHIQFINCSVHDNNLGLVIFNPTSSSEINEDILIQSCSVFSNANDGININATVGSGILKGVRIIGNESYSNGWPANGTGFSNNTPPGWLQNGSNRSSSGVGIDIITGGLLQEVTITGNRCHDNVYDGISIDGHNGQMTVNVASASVTWASGPKFNLQWKTGQPIVIGTNTFLIASVASATALTLQTSAGTATGATAYSSSDIFATVVGNLSFNNGNTAATIGCGFFCYFANRVSYSANVAYQNACEGFGVNSSADVSYTSCRAYNNNLSAAANLAGFYVYSAIGTSIVACGTDDMQGTPTQLNGIYITPGSINTFVASPSIYGQTALSDNGTGTTYLGVGVLLANGYVNATGSTPTGVITGVAIGSTTTGTASAGTATLPAHPKGFLEINIGGTVYKVPYYNS